MPGLYTEADYENSVIELFRNELGYEYAYGPDIERDFYSPLYEEVLLDSLYNLNRDLPDDAIGYARGLYRALRELDGYQAHQIVVERLPDDEAWYAVQDRLNRAVVGSNCLQKN